MHPLIRLVCFIIFAAFVSLGQYAIIFLGFILLILIWLVSHQGPSPKAWLMLKRMRVFYLSILLVYLWFTPGEIIFPLFHAWSPTYEGFIQAIERILALGLLVLAVETLLRLTPRPLLLTGLYYLATPMVLLGMNRNQFIIRIMLTLDLVSSNTAPRPEKQLKTSKSKFPACLERTQTRWRYIIGYYFDDITQRLADKITNAANMESRNESITFELQAPPHKLQWLWPISLVLLFSMFR